MEMYLEGNTIYVCGHETDDIKNRFSAANEIRVADCGGVTFDLGASISTACICGYGCHGGTRRTTAGLRLEFVPDVEEFSVLCGRKWW